MSNITTPAELFGLLADSEGADEPLTSLRYYLYARKSTQNEDRQERSIPDQIQSCIETVVDRKGLTVVGVIREKGSAKEAGLRDEFRAMISNIKAGKANGIIAWHPDRLSRNMKEAGEIIDLVDKGVIKDLQFATHTFENTPTGKMTLGISFVLSKQYSEHLSESVSRGNKRITESGRFLGKLKHGYYIDEDRRLLPDEENFAVVKKIFTRRMNGETQAEIAKWLNTLTYTVRPYGKQPMRYKWDKDAVSKLLRDPVYAGVLKYGSHTVVLSDHYDFEAAVSVPDFMMINRVSDMKSRRLESSMMVKNPQSTKAKLLRGMITCGYCSKPMTSSITSKKLKSEKRYYYYYKCETLTCSFRNKSIRAKVVVGFIAEFFSEYHFTTRNNYKVHVQRVKETNRKRAKRVISQIASASKMLQLKEEEYDSVKETVRVNPSLAPHYDLDKLLKEVENLRLSIEKNVERRKSLDTAVPTYEKYLELMGNASVTIPKIHDIELMNGVIRMFFSNFKVTATGVGKKQRCEIEYKLKEPWDGFLKSNDFDRGRGERTRTFDLTVPNRAR